MSAPKISIIVPCYNAASFLPTTILSVVNQNISNWELILVDDESVDNTWEIIQNFTIIDSRILSFKKVNEGGPSAARNFGFSKSNPASEYLFFLDSDDSLEPDTLFKMSSYLDTHPEVGLLGCQFQEIANDGQKLGVARRSRWAPGIIFPHELEDNEFKTPFTTFFCATGQGPFAMYRRSVYLQTDGWETQFWPHEDTDMFCQMALLSEVHYLPDRLYLKRIHPAQSMNDGERIQRLYSAFRKKWDSRKPKNTFEAITLKRAKKYYYSMHRPCRDLKVAKKSFSQFFRKPTKSNLIWGLTLIKSALLGFTLGRFKV